MPDNGICERFHKTVLDEFYRIAFRKRIYATIEQLQADLDVWMRRGKPAWLCDRQRRASSAWSTRSMR